MYLGSHADQTAHASHNTPSMWRLSLLTTANACTTFWPIGLCEPKRKPILPGDVSWPYT